MTNHLTLRVLLVEDDPGDVRLVRLALKSAQYARYVVERADCLSAAMGFLHNHRFDVVLLDLSLPDSHGIDTIQAFRGVAPDLPIVVLTGLDDRDIGLRAIREGCQDYLVKGNADGETMARTIIHSVQRKLLEVELVQAKARLQESYDDLEQRVIERTNELRRMAVEATEAEERERQAIARDLHDDLGQMLHVAKIKLEQLAKPLPQAAQEALVGELSGLVGDASRMVRSLTSQLSPPILHELGLVPALSWLATEMERSFGLKVVVKSAEGVMPPLAPAPAAFLFRAVRELLINVSKHAATDTARITVEWSDGKFVLSVADDGTGVAEWPLVADKGFGLASMRERITFLGGSMDIQTKSGCGMVVTLVMPFERRIMAIPLERRATKS